MVSAILPTVENNITCQFYEFPDNWYRVCACSDLNATNKITVPCFNSEVVIWRDTSGINAYLNKQQLRIVEYLDQVFVYYCNDTKSKPREFQRIPLNYNVQQFYRTQFFLDLPASYYEPKENSVDMTHLHFIHRSPCRQGAASFKVTEWTETFPQLKFNLHIQHEIFWKKIPLKLSFTFVSPGLDQVDVSGPLTFSMVSMGLPVSKRTSLYLYQVFTPKGKNLVLTKLKHYIAVKNIKAALRQDYPIWQHKQFNSTPIYCSLDTSVARFRKYFQKFYTSSAS